MDSLNSERYVQRATFGSMFLNCFMVSLGLCLSMVGGLPLPNYNIVLQSEIVYISTRLIAIVYIFSIAAIVFYLNRGKERFHENLEVLWPMHCHHCARLVGISHDRRQYADVDVEHRVIQRPTFVAGTSRSSSLNFPLNGPRACNGINQTYGVRELPSSPSEDTDSLGDLPMQSELIDLSSSNPLLRIQFSRTTHLPGANNEESLSSIADDGMAFQYVQSNNSTPVYADHHKSLLYLFYFISIIIVCNTPFVVIADIMCLIYYMHDQTLMESTVLVIQASICIIFSCMLCFVMNFFHIYHDAIFIRTRKFSLLMGYLFASCAHLTIFKLMQRINGPSDFLHSLDLPCALNGTFGYFLMLDNVKMIPLYAECGIITTCILLHISSSVVPRSVLRSCEESPTPFPIERASILWRKLLDVFLKNLRWKMPSWRNRSRSDRIISNYDFKNKLRSLVHKVSTIVTFAAVVFCVITPYLGLGNPFNMSEYSKTYVMWCLEAAFSLPLVGLYCSHAFIRKSKERTFPIKKIVVDFQELENHDKVLLMSCSAIFLVNILRFIGAVRYLIYPLPKEPDALALSVSSIVYAMFKISFTWQMSSFILTVQRQPIQYSDSHDSGKWTHFCLIYTIVLNAALWLVDMIEVQSWHELDLFFGELGILAGSFLKPVTSLYTVHATVITFEHFKLLYSNL